MTVETMDLWIIGIQLLDACQNTFQMMRVESFYLWKPYKIC